MSTATTARPVRSTIRQADTHIRARRSFTSGNMNGRVVTDGSVYGTGVMPGDWARAYWRDVRDIGISYIVTSYATPIAWIRSDGLIVVPPVSYSVTTARHQYEARTGLDVQWGKTYRHDTLPMTAL